MNINTKSEAGSPEGAGSTSETSETKKTTGRTRRSPRRRSSRSRTTASQDGTETTAPSSADEKASAGRTRAPARRRRAAPKKEEPETTTAAPVKRARRPRKKAAKKTTTSAAASATQEKAPAEPEKRAAAKKTTRSRPRRPARAKAAAETPPVVEDTPREVAEAAPRRRSRRSGRGEGPARAGSGLQRPGEFFSPETLDACQRAIGYHFRDMTLLHNALTHSSIKSSDRPSYERMEFLGDSVVGLVVAEYIYRMLPDCDEGELTKVKSAVVSTDGLAAVADRLGLGSFLAVGRGIQMNNTLPKSLMADVFEGVVGAVYLDRGYEAVRLYVLDHLRSSVEEALSDRGARNFKSVLQQVAQRDYGKTPHYDVLGRSGPDHARVFTVVAVVGERKFRPAKAPTKKEAEQAAAKLALKSILMAKSRKPSGDRGRSPRKRAS